MKKPGGSLAQKKLIQELLKYDIDIFALRDNILRTPAERIKRHQFALNTVEKLRNAKKNYK